jgi:MFS family permease
MSPARTRATVVLCHFAAAFGALGMPPLLSLILHDLAPDADERLVGWLYIMPTICLAVSAPAWGWLADRWGRKLSLLRAQIGLALSFLLAGLAGSPGMLMAALCLQGLLGGTFSASNAYLAEVLPRQYLPQSLNLTQASARLALILAPVVVGYLVDRHLPPGHAYLALSVLPVIAVLALLPLPDRKPTAMTAQSSAQSKSAAGRIYPEAAVMVGQVGFTLALIASFPFILPYAMVHYDLGAGMAGWMFGLPHIVYLLAFLPMGRWMTGRDAMPLLALGCAVVAGSLAIQAAGPSLAIFIIARLVLGAGMTLAYVALNTLIAATIRDSTAGRSFGWFDSGAKLATIVAGVSAGEIAQRLGPAAVFGTSAAVACMVAFSALFASRLSQPLPSTSHR